MVRAINYRALSKEKRCFFLCDYADGEISQKKNNKKKGSARETATKINAEQLAVEKKRARKNGTTTAPTQR